MTNEARITELEAFVEKIAGGYASVLPEVLLRRDAARLMEKAECLHGTPLNFIHLCVQCDDYNESVYASQGGQ